MRGELFDHDGRPMTHVPYKGTLPALNDVIAVTSADVQRSRAGLSADQAGGCASA
jgi:hypothetical protein